MGALDLYKHLSKKNNIKGVDLRRYILDIKDHELEDFENERFVLYLEDDDIEFEFHKRFGKKGD